MSHIYTISLKLLNLPYFTTGYHFSSDVVDAMEKYSMHLANSVMERAEAVCRDLNATNVIL